MLPPFELLVEGFTNRNDVIRAVDTRLEDAWLKSWLLGILVLDQPFAVEFNDESEATELADRLRSLGFRCKVWNGPDPSQRVGHRAEANATPDPGGSSGVPES